MFVERSGFGGRAYYEQFPVATPGRSIAYLPPEIGSLWQEIRDAASVGASTVAVMGCRVLLHHLAHDIADEKEKPKAKNFKYAECVDFLNEKGYLPPNSGEWVAEVKNQGNEANHDLVIKSSKDAELLIKFCAALLTPMYEIPGDHQASKPTSRVAAEDVAALTNKIDSALDETPSADNA